MCGLRPTRTAEIGVGAGGAVARGRRSPAVVYVRPDQVVVDRFDLGVHVVAEGRELGRLGVADRLLRAAKVIVARDDR